MVSISIGGGRKERERRQFRTHFLHNIEDKRAISKFYLYKFLETSSWLSHYNTIRCLDSPYHHYNKAKLLDPESKECRCALLLGWAENNICYWKPWEMFSNMKMRRTSAEKSFRLE